LLGSSVWRRLRARFLRDVSIQRKLTLLTLITTGVTLVLSGVAYVTYDLFAFRQAMERDRLILAQIVGANSTAALAFDDPKAGKATLASLSAQPRIVAACLYGKDGKVFATYHRADERSGPILRADECPVAGRGYLEVSQPIILDGELVGAIAIESDLQEFYARLGRYASIGLVAIVVSSFIGWRLSLRLQQAISAPILNLVQTARAVSENMDYSVRAVKYSADEVGLLIEGFNDMLAQIEKRDAALTELSKNLNQLYRLSTALQEPLSLPEQIDRVLEGARQVVAVDRFYIWAVAPEKRTLTPLGGAGFTPEELRDFAGVEIPLTQAGAMYKAYREGISLVFNDANPLPAELRLREPYSRLKALQTRSFIVIPMIARGDPVGLFTADNRRSGQPILAQTVDLLQIFALHAAVAIQNARLFREIEQKSQELEIASRHKSQFLANMSHELRTPLNAILGYTELIVDKIYGEVPEKIRDVLERVQKSGRHLLGLINDVLDLSKIEAGQLVLTLGDYSFHDVVQVVATSVGSLAAEKRLRLSVDVAPDLPVARGDERRITQVLLNLVGNAIKFTETGEVVVRVAAADGAFLASVTDTGPGIREEDRQKIFEEFQQGDSLPTKPKVGTGLGLTIAKRIVEMHGGRIWVESELGKGSTFFVSVPVRASEQGGRV
jgi:signal transduction histidine kinase/HAMP domain-containing protein